LYILLYVQDQYSYDRHHVDAKDIYRVNRIDKGQEGTYNLAITAMPMAPLMKRDFPEVRQFTRVIPFIGVDKHLISHGDKHLWIKDAYIVDSTFFDVFTYQPVQGNLQTALYKPNTVVLLKPLADELFGKEDPIGKTITLDNTDQPKADYTVTAVAAEGPGKSHLHATLFTAANSEGLARNMLRRDSWVSETFIATYVKLQPGTNPAALEKKLLAFEEKYAGQEKKKWNVQEKLYLQPIGSIHTTGGLDNPGYRNTRRCYVFVGAYPDRHIDTGYCVYQFHEPGYGPGFQTGQGSGGAQSHRRRQARSYPAVPGRNLSAGVDSGADRSPTAIAGFAVAQRHHGLIGGLLLSEGLPDMADAGRLRVFDGAGGGDLSGVLPVCL
jgi:hypothetical protein